MNNFKINVHGVIALVLVLMLIVVALLKGSTAALVYAAVAILVYSFFTFQSVILDEKMKNEKRKIITAEERFNVFRRLVGLHLAAGLAVVGLILPFPGFLALAWLIVAAIAGLGIPYLVLQRQSE